MTRSGEDYQQNRQAIEFAWMSLPDERIRDHRDRRGRSALHARQADASVIDQTLLRRLEAKGAVGHESNERTFVFLARLKEDAVKRTATRGIEVSRM